MSQTVTLNGTSYQVPDNMQTSAWGAQLTSYLVALGSGVLQKAGGSFTLTAEADFGANYGFKSVYLKAGSGTHASAGAIRIPNTLLIAWRNAANSADVTFGVNSSNNWSFNGTAVTTAELGYLSGVTSAIQTQLGTKVTSGGALGTPSSGTLSNCTGLPVSTGISGLGTGAATFLATPSSANFAAMVTDEVGTGSVVLNTDPTFNTRIGLLAQADVRFYDSDSSNYIDVQAPATVASNFTLTLPTTVGSANQVLAGDGSGNLSWATPFTNPMTTQGDMVIGGASGVSSRLAVTGTTGALLKGGSTPAWSSIISEDGTYVNIASGGLKFNGSTAFNYYTEGTWTPALTNTGGGSTTLNGSPVTTAYWTRVGRLVTIFVKLSCTSTPTNSGSGDLIVDLQSVSGLPAPATTGIVAIGALLTDRAAYTSAATYIAALYYESGTFFRVYFPGSRDTSALDTLKYNAFGSASGMLLTFTMTYNA